MKNSKTYKRHPWKCPTLLIPNAIYYNKAIGNKQETCYHKTAIVTAEGKPGSKETSGRGHSNQRKELRFSGDTSGLRKYLNRKARYAHNYNEV